MLIIKRNPGQRFCIVENSTRTHWYTFVDWDGFEGCYISYGINDAFPRQRWYPLRHVYHWGNSERVRIQWEPYEHQLKFGITAPTSMKIWREEIYEANAS